MAITPNAKLLFECGPNWAYATGTQISDPALYYESPNGKSHIVVSDLEISLMRKTAQVSHIHGYAEVRAAIGSGPVKLESIIAWLMSIDGRPAGVITVPQNFPSNLFVQLKNAGLPLEVSGDELIFPARAIKTDAEIKKLAQVGKINDEAFKLAHAILKAAKIEKNNTLKWQGATLTAEILRGEMNAFLVKNGCLEFHDGPIIACGPQGAMPHERGHGPLKANQLIVLDCFPRHSSGYWADCTRTYLKGKPGTEQANLYDAVMVAQEMALKLIKPGANGGEIHNAVVDFFNKAEYRTGADKAGNPEGFFHGLGHGVGLELHEPGPRMLSRADCPLLPGYVTSVEPGLYYTALGGVRIEDTVVVTEKGYKSFTSLSKKDWIIK